MLSDQEDEAADHHVSLCLNFVDEGVSDASSFDVDVAADQTLDLVEDLNILWAAKVVVDGESLILLDKERTVCLSSLSGLVKLIDLIFELALSGIKAGDIDNIVTEALKPVTEVSVGGCLGQHLEKVRVHVHFYLYY